MAQSLIGALRVNLGLDTAQFSSGLTGARAKMARFGRQMQLVGAGISAVGVGVAASIRSQLNKIDDISKTAQQVGLTTEALSQLQYAADLSGVSMTSLQSGLQRMSREMVDNADKFEELGVSIRDAQGNLLPTEVVLGRMADLFATMPDGAEKTAIAVDILGRSGAEMIPLLNGGSAALTAMMTEADALGLTITKDTAVAAENFNDNLSRLSATVGGLVTQITAQLAPVLARISDWAVQASTRFRSLSPEMQEFTAILAGLSVVLGPLVVAAGLLVTALAGLSAPVLAAVAAVTALTAGFVAFAPQIIASKDAIADFVTNGIATIKTKFMEIIAYLRNLPAQMLQIGGDIIQGLVDGILQKWEAVKGSVTGVWDDLAGGVKDFFRIRSPSRLMMEYGGYISQGLGMGITNSAAIPINAMDDIAGRIASTAGEMKLSFQDAFVSFASGASSAQDAARALLQSLRQIAAQKLFESAFGTGGGIGGFVGNLLGIPGNANGTRNFAGGLSRVNERGGEIINLPSGSQIIPNDISKRMADGASNGGGVLQIMLDDRLIASMQSENLQQMIKVTSVSAKQQRETLGGQVSGFNMRGTTR